MKSAAPASKAIFLRLYDNWLSPCFLSASVPPWWVFGCGSAKPLRAGSWNPSDLALRNSCFQKFSTLDIQSSQTLTACFSITSNIFFIFIVFVSPTKNHYAVFQILIYNSRPLRVSGWCVSRLLLDGCLAEGC
jgi:hypothetical protein